MLAFDRVSLGLLGAYGPSISLVFLHALLGNRSTFSPFLKHLSRELESQSMSIDAWLPDLRNHGQSPHALSHTMNDLCSDLNLFLQQHSLERVVLCGHSMGGKLAMQYALSDGMSARVAAVISLDAAPATYTHQHSHVFEAMESVDFSRCFSKRDIEQQLSTLLSNRNDRAFVLTNIQDLNESDSPLTNQPERQSRFGWRVNVSVLARDEHHIHAWQLGGAKIRPNASISGDSNCNTVAIYGGPTLFIGGDASTRLTTPAYLANIPTQFPNSELVMVNAGHFVFSGDAPACARHMATFLKKHRPNLL